MSASMRLTVVSTALPRRCGLATFTSDLTTALREVAPHWDMSICAVDRDGLGYGPDVAHVIRHDDPGAYRRAAAAIAAAGTDIVMIQHEYGIFGGLHGGHILELAAELRERGVPYTVTLHTVLPKPSPGQAATLGALCGAAARVTVFTRTAQRLAVQLGLADPESIDVVPHGAPTVLRGLPDPGLAGKAVRQALDDAEDTRVLATFGLLGPGKGLDHAIAALPAVVARHPDVRYLIAGATHPEVARTEGESYRQRLVDLAEQRGVGKHVDFIDAFLTEDELAVLLSRTHLYLTPYRSPDQICSGALTFALAAGCPVVSTDYLYARDMLARRPDDSAPGLIVPCGDVDAYAEAIDRILSDRAEWQRAHAAAEALGATLSWPSVATRFAEVVAAARARRVRRVGPAVAPPVRLDHLDRLTDEIGIIQFARGDRPDPDSGYCVDDVARLAIVATGLAALPGQRDPRPTRWSGAAVRFLAAATTGQGMHNLMGYDGAWRDEPHDGDHVGRAVWGLGTLASSAIAPPEVRAEAHRLLLDCLPTVERLEFPRSVAYAVLGLAHLDDPLPAVQAALAGGARRLDGWLGELDPAWPWFEEALTYDNGRLAEALVAGAVRLGDRRMLARALTTVDWYLEQVSDGSILRCVGNTWRFREGPPDCGDEQPLDAAAAVELAVGAWRATRQWRYARQARRSYAWFLGANRAGVPLYDERTGGCRDGLAETAANDNEGAESTLAYYQALLSLIHSGLVPVPGVAARVGRRRPPASLAVLGSR